MDRIIILAAILLISSGVSLGSKTKVTWFYETNCPGTRAWFKNSIEPYYQYFLDNVDFELIPYGNAQTKIVNGNIGITCQHGEPECLGNKYQACALKLIDNVARKLGYCMCVMTNSGADVYRKCAEDGPVQTDFNTLNRCAQGPDGLRYLAALGDKQHNQPFTIPYVPFMTINGKPLTKQEQSEAWNQYGQFLCKRLPPGNKPKYCTPDSIDIEF